MHTKSIRFETVIEFLEDRIAPATVIQTGINLTISDPEGSLVVETTGIDGEIKITDASGPEMFDGITGKITINGRSTGSNSTDAINFIANTKPFDGNLIVNSGDGNDTLSLSGTINGSVTINTGSGDDIVIFPDMEVKIGKSFKVNDTGGQFMIFDMNDRNLTVGGSLSLVGITVLDMGISNSLDVAKGLTIAAHPAAVMPFTVLLSGGNTIVGGDLKITSGNTNDTVNLSGTINGNVIVNTGQGNDTIVLTDAAVKIGKSLKVNAIGGGNALFDLNDRNLTVGGSLSLAGITVFDMGTGNTLNVAKAMKISANPSAIAPLTVLLSGAETIVGGDLKITSGVTNDVVSFTSKVNIGGNFNNNSGGGNNTVVFTPVAASPGVAGSFTHSGLEGVDVIVFGAETSVEGRTNLILGNGINTFVDTATSQYGGDVIVNGGFNTNTCVITGQLDGNLSVAMAAGGAGNTTVITASIAEGKKFKYRSGNDGTLEVLTLAPAVASVINIDAKLGDGSSTFTLGPNLSLTGKVVGTGGTYTFNQGTAILLPALKLINYP